MPPPQYSPIVSQDGESHNLAYFLAMSPTGFWSVKYGMVITEDELDNTMAAVAKDGLAVLSRG